MKARHYYYLALGGPSAECLAFRKAQGMTECLASGFDDLNETQPSEELAWPKHTPLIYPLC